jgi:hypothetical protein
MFGEQPVRRKDLGVKLGLHADVLCACMPWLALGLLTPGLSDSRGERGGISADRRREAPLR